MNFYEVNVNDVKNLDKIGLPNIVKRLISAEFGLKDYSHCSNTDAPDGGVDAALHKSEKVLLDGFVPSTQTVFQFKATEMSEQKCVNEITNSSHVFLQEKLRAGYDFVIISNKDHLPLQNKQKREEAMQKALNSIGATNTKPVFLDAEDIQNWINQHQDVIYYLRPEFFKNKNYAGVENFYEWYKKDAKTEFQSDEKLEQCVQNIKNNILNGKMSNISGLAGIGKTRTVLEACARMTEEDKSRIIYIRKFDRATLIPFLNTLDKNKSFILVIDECDKSCLEEIKRALIDSNIHCVTIDYDAYDTSEELTLDKLSNTVIEAIVKKILPEFDLNIQDTVIKIADGFPRFAIQIAQDIKIDAAAGNNINISTFKDEDIYKLLLRDRAGKYDADTEKVLSVLSLFTKIGYNPRFTDATYRSSSSRYLVNPEEMKTIEKIFNLDGNKVFEVYNEFLKRNIIQRKGLAISVQPYPLYIYLAKKWVKSTLPDNMLNIFNTLPNTLQERFIARIKFLDNVSDFARVFIGSKESKFSSAEMLNSPDNELFKEFVDIAPDLAMNSLEYAFDGWSSEDFKNRLTDNRRRIVWALDRIIFNKDLYERAASFLFRLASGENEGIGNNATGELVKRMQVFLSQTEANFSQRIKFLHSLKPQTSHEYGIILKMIEKGLDNRGHYNCCLGPEYQGTRTLKSYEPQYRLEISEYFSQLGDFLISMINIKDIDLKKDILKIITNNLNPLMFDSSFDKYEPIVSKLLQENPDMLPDFLIRSRISNTNAFEKLMHYRDSIISNGDNNLNFLFNLYIVPSKMEVGRLMFGYEDIDLNKEDLLIKQKAEQIAQKYLLNEQLLYSSLEMFVEKNPKNISEFASKIGAEISDYKKFVSNLLNIHKTKNNENFSLLATSMHEIWKRDPDYIDEVMDALLCDSFWISRPTIVNFMGVVHNGFLKSDLDIILKLASNGSLTISQLKTSNLSIVLKNSMCPEDLVKYLTALYQIYGCQSSDFIVEAILFCIEKDNKSLKAFERLICILMKEPKNISILFNDDNNAYKANRVFHNIDISGTEAVEVFKTIKNAVNRDIGRAFLYENTYLSSLVRHLIEKHKNTMIPYILESMGQEENICTTNWMFLFGETCNGSMASNPYLFSNTSDLIVMEYLKTASEPAKTNIRRHIIELVNLLQKDGDQIEWSLLINYLINSAENMEELNMINANINNYSWAGKTSEYYKQYEPLFIKMKDSDKPHLCLWAKQTLEQLARYIKEEENQEEELGY